MHARGWRIAAPSLRVRSQPRPSQVMDHELVLFRDAQGTAHALIDRCPHRGVQLSKGSVQDGKLTCRYHGWRFDGDGRCAHIPSLRSDQRVPGGIETGRLPSVERDGYIWVWAGDGEPATAGPLPIPELARGHWVQSTIEMDCHWLKAIENNVDPTHAAFTHRWSHPQWYQRKFRGLREGSSELRLTEHGFALFLPPTSKPEDPIPSRPMIRTQFDLPDRVTVTFARPFHQVILLHSIPTGPHTSRLEAMVKIPVPFGRRIRFSEKEHVIFRQDRVVMESADHWTRKIGHEFERSVEADYSMLLVRRIVELAESGLWETKRNALTQRRILEIRA